ncbi:MAG: carbohydrate kinase family protein [Patescibacteria group bacterium]|jgi:ribokinase
MKKRYDVITFGSATRDVYLQSEKFRGVADKKAKTRKVIRLALGAKYDIPIVYFETGGGGTNTAVGFARLGFKTAVVTRIGANDARGKILLHTLQENGVDTRFVVHDKKDMTAYSVLLRSPKGERTILVHRGASSRFTDAGIQWTKLKKTKWFYVSSLGGNLPLMKKLVHFAAKHHISVAVNPGRAELDKGYRALAPVLKGATVVLLNREEAARLTGIPFEQERAMFKKLAIGLPGMVVVTDGPRGALVADNTYRYKGKPHTITVHDTTGAGDSFGMGFVAGYMHKNDIAYALQTGIASSESVIQKIGAKNGLLTHFPKKDPREVTITSFPN